MQTAVEITKAYSGSNDPPSDFDRTHISQLLIEETIALASIDAEISELKIRLTALTSLREEREGIVKKLRAITSPLRLLPPEILSLIFTNCPRDEVGRTIKNPSHLLAPLLLMHVCSRWRYIAMDTSAIWTELQLVLSKTNVPRDTAMATQWAENASPLPVSLAVECAECHCPEVLQRGLTQISRLKSLHLRLFPASLCVLGAQSSDALNVESLQVDITDLRYPLNPATLSQSYSVFANCPSLRSFTLLSHTRYTSTLQFSIPWSQLTKLHLSESHLSFSCMAVFIQCTNLVDITFGILEGVGDDLPLPDLPITFPFLADARFIFKHFDPSTMEEFLRPLISPSLKRLALEYTDEAREWPQLAFGAFQLRSSLNLETLQLDGMLLELIDLREAFESLPSLKSFTLTFIGERREGIELFQVLTWDGMHSLLPQLERLKIGLFMSDLSLKYCIAMLKSRLGREGGPASQLQLLWLEADEYTLPLDWWWWQWKLPLVFPTVECKFTSLNVDVDVDVETE